MYHARYTYAVKLRVLALISFVGSTPPSEFLIFRPGLNPNTNGPPALFDAEAATAVMAAYERNGVDLMIDLNHESLDAPLRADSKDARGWFKLSLRPDGSLWAVDVRWTPDGARRLTEKTQRYISPAFSADDATERVLELVNVAICAMPAAYDAPALVAAARAFASQKNVATLSCSMDPKLVQEALDALQTGDDAKATEILKGLIAAAASNGEVPSAPDASETPPATEAADPPPADSPANPAAPGEDPKKDPVAKAMCAKLGVATSAEAFTALDALLKLRTDADADAVRLDATKRAELVGELVKLGAETPATAWADAAKRVPCKRLASEPVAELTSRVVALRGLKPKTRITPPASGADDDLTEHEQSLAAKMNPEQRARFVVLRKSRRSA